MSDPPRRPLYAIDTSVLMEWQFRAYPTDVFASLVDRVDGLIAEGRFLSPSVVEEELKAVGTAELTGFYECTQRARHGFVPRNRQTSAWIDERRHLAWMVEGKPCGKQPRHKSVSVPSVDTMLGRNVFSMGAIIPGLNALAGC